MHPRPGSIFHRALSYPHHTSQLVVLAERRRRIIVQEEYTAVGLWHLRRQVR